MTTEALRRRNLDYLARMNELGVDVEAQAEERDALIKELNETSMTDGLTGLWNQTAIKKLAEAEIALLEEAGNGGALAVVIVDMNGLKKINDLHGHAFGDRAIAAIGQAMRTKLRRSTLAGRSGGDEFTLIIPAGDEGSPDRMMMRVEDETNTIFNTGPKMAMLGLQLSLSWGISVYCCSKIPQRINANTALRKLRADADKRMYAMKNLKGGARE